MSSPSECSTATERSRLALELGSGFHRACAGLLAALALVLGALACGERSAGEASHPKRADRPAAPPTADDDNAPAAKPGAATTESAGLEPSLAGDPAAALPVWPKHIRTLIIGGGSLPSNSEISIEQNAQLAHDVLPGPHGVLFGGGPGTYSVRIETPPATGLLHGLGELFAPNIARNSRYRTSTLRAERADAANVERRLRAALAESGNTPLTVFIAAHGEQGRVPEDNAVMLWGHDALTPRRIAELHDRAERPLQLIVTSCFSGGFAELAFAVASAARGPSPAPRCGLFAGTWDRETSGCDPNPNRATQESYSQHMLGALGGRDREGKPLPLAQLDLDGDGRISTLEAHAHARIHALSIDVPTTTSERYLRHVQRRGDPPAGGEALLPEDAAVVRALSSRLGLPTEFAAGAALQRQQVALDALGSSIADAENAVDRAYYALATRLLERFPVLDDPFHPEHAETRKTHADEIRRLLDGSPEAQAYRSARAGLEALDLKALALELENAQTLRLVRAFETLGLSAALQRRGGPEHAHYERLLRCERDAFE